MTGNGLGTVEKREVKKVRVNNRLRKMLRNIIARVKIVEGDRKEKISAAQFLIDNINEKNILVMKNVLVEEKDQDVKDKINIGLSINDLRTSPDIQVRIQAIEVMSGSLDLSVRNVLNEVLARDDAGKYIEKDTALIRSAESALKKIEEN
eukprot:TRINITY_DN203184_c0_g1_i1.p1 TRINITY_DN203184_c0_g1~~TRINITY_DN203184_c0_g1_i1.p1  ORF type:complete len:162 (-),score=17.37 TRINITY_DN203184_c0_g1_i1:7-456(-)